MSIFDLDWENQNAVSAYPFTEDAPYNNIIVDANFQQFDNFIPVLNYIEVSTDFLTLNITYDTGTTNFIFLQSDYVAGTNFLRLMVGTRYIGKLTFQDGVNTLWNTFVGQVLQFNLSFVATTVKSISLNSGVFSLAGLFGNVVLTTPSSDNTIFYNTIGSNGLTFNAVGNFKLPYPLLSPALKLLNLISPTNNNIFISSDQVIQINGDGIGSLNVSLVGSQPGSNLTKIVNTNNF
jgi:hypothetical protein